MTQARLPLPAPPSSPIDPRLVQAIDALDLGETARRILLALAQRDRSLGELAGIVDLGERTVKSHLQQLDRRGVVGPAWGVGWGLRPSWVRELGIGDGCPACVPAS